VAALCILPESIAQRYRDIGAAIRPSRSISGGMNADRMKPVRDKGFVAAL
jgi:hypothetical protein